MQTPTDPMNSSLHELSITDAAAAIRTGSLTASDYAATLLKRAYALSDLRAFVTLDEDTILEKPRDRPTSNGKRERSLGRFTASRRDQGQLQHPRHADIDRNQGAGYSSALGGRRSRQVDARAGAILFGKNNLVEMSYGLTGLNAHYGQVEKSIRPHPRHRWLLKRCWSLRRGQNRPSRAGWRHRRIDPRSILSLRRRRISPHDRSVARPRDCPHLAYARYPWAHDSDRRGLRLAGCSRYRANTDVQAFGSKPQRTSLWLRSQAAPGLDRSRS